MDGFGWFLAIEPKQLGPLSLEKAKKGYDEAYKYHQILENWTNRHLQSLNYKNVGELK